jgi:hypothetical protein
VARAGPGSGRRDQQPPSRTAGGAAAHMDRELLLVQVLVLVLVPMPVLVALEDMEVCQRKFEVVLYLLWWVFFIFLKLRVD